MTLPAAVIHVNILTTTFLLRCTTVAALVATQTARVMTQAALLGDGFQRFSLSPFWYSIS
jgi:hypothetical protein